MANPPPGALCFALNRHFLLTSLSVDVSQILRALLNSVHELTRETARKQARKKERKGREIRHEENNQKDEKTAIRNGGRRDT